MWRRFNYSVLRPPAALNCVLRWFPGWFAAESVQLQTIWNVSSVVNHFVTAVDKMHSEKKGYQNGFPWVLLLQMVPFFQTDTLFSLIIMLKKVTNQSATQTTLINLGLYLYSPVSQFLFKVHHLWCFFLWQIFFTTVDCTVLWTPRPTKKYLKKKPKKHLKLYHLRSNQLAGLCMYKLKWSRITAFDFSAFSQPIQLNIDKKLTLMMIYNGMRYFSWEFSASAALFPDNIIFHSFQIENDRLVFLPLFWKYNNCQMKTWIEIKKII